MDYGAILKRSWELTKKYKWLWVYGLVLAVFGGGGSGGGSPSGSFGGFKKELPEKLPEQTVQVLGQATDTISEWFKAIPLSTWLILGISTLLLILLFIVINWIICSWAKGALIAGLYEANQGNNVTLVSTSPKGLKAIKPLIVYGLIAFGISLGTILGAVVLVTSGYLVFSFSKLGQTLWLVLSSIVGGLLLIVFLVLFAMVNVYADRQIVLKGTAPWPAWKTGFRFARRRFLPTLVMGIINQAIGCLVGCLSLLIILLVVGIPAVILIVPLFKNGFHFPKPPVIVILILLFLIFINLNLLVRAILTVFRYGTWNLFFDQILKEEQYHE